MDEAVAVTSTDSSAPSSSCKAVTVTVCAVFQSVAVNVRVVDGTVTAPMSSEATVTDTSAVGWLSRRTSKSAVPPSATGRLDGSTVRPASSLSSTDTATTAVTAVYS